MNVVFSKVKIIDPESDHHLRIVDIEIKNGTIHRIGKNLTAVKTRSIDLKGISISPGWVDLGTFIGEPGFEHREDLKSVSQAAIKGGYTALAPFPNSSPPVDTKSAVTFLINHSTSLPIHIYPIGAISKGAMGKDLSELQDMKEEGAVAFSDGHPGTGGSILLRAMDYVKVGRGLIIDQGLDPALVPDAQVNEGEYNVQMGLKGQPVLAEKMQLQRNIDLAHYSQARLMCHNISSKDGLDIVRKGRKKSTDIGASVNAFHLCFNESAVSTFDANYKLAPPLRSESDRKALIKGIVKGQIDIICSGHTPLDPEEKVMAFSDATPGCIGLQTTYAMIKTHVGEAIDDQTLVNALSTQPRKWLGLPGCNIKEGNIAELTLFSPSQKWTYQRANNASRSDNSPLIGQELTGRVVGVYAKGHYHDLQ